MPFQDSLNAILKLIGQKPMGLNNVMGEGQRPRRRGESHSAWVKDNFKGYDAVNTGNPFIDIAGMSEDEYDNILNGVKKLQDTKMYQNADRYDLNRHEINATPPADWFMNIGKTMAGHVRTNGEDSDIQDALDVIKKYKKIKK
jgi:hypothetical protein